MSRGCSSRTVRVRHGWLAAAGLFVVASCGSGDDGSAVTGTSASSYCADVDQLAGLLEGGGSAEDYDELLTRIVDESPDDHAPTWSLMLVLSAEPFDYDNFNPAVDSLERLVPELEATCPDLRKIIVDDSGRIGSRPTDD